MPSDSSENVALQATAAVALRPYAEGDFPALFALDQVCFPAGIAYSANELKYFLRHPRCFTVVAEAGGQITGFSLAERLREQGRPVGHLITIDVAPDARRSGTGSLLISEIERRLREVNAAVLRLEVASDNEAAQRFYARHGFAVTGRIPGYYAGRIDALTMAKHLSGQPA